MRITRGVGPGLVPVMLVAAVAAGCGGHQTSGQVVPNSQGRLVSTVSGEDVHPGDRRAPYGAAAVTTTTQPPIGRTASPVPSGVPVSRPPLMLGAVATTSTSPAPIPTTTMTTAPMGATTAAGQGPGSGGGASQTDQDAPTTTTTVGMLGRAATPRS